MQVVLHSIAELFMKMPPDKDVICDLHDVSHIVERSTACLDKSKWPVVPRKQHFTKIIAFG